MALKEAYRRLEEVTNIPKPCVFMTYFARLTKEDQKTLNELVARGVSTRIIVRLLADEGHKVGAERFNDHRLNRCKCPKESK